MAISKIDMHMHCNASDGTDSPAEILEKVEKAGIKIFSVTDHDTIKGTLAVEKRLPQGIRFVRGIEFSCKTPVKKCHILGYDFDPENEEFQAAIREGKAIREQKLQNRFHFLEELHHIEISVEDRQALMSMESAGKPHLATVLIRMGYASDIDGAIRKYLKHIPGEKNGQDRITAASAIDGILAAGGVPVWAHPLGGEGEKHLTEEEFARQLTCLLQMGIQGLECYYSRYTEEEVEFLLEQARKYGLLVSGGSDYHGANKNIPLGTLNAYGKEVKKEALTLLKMFS